MKKGLIVLLLILLVVIGAYALSTRDSLPSGDTMKLGPIGEQQPPKPGVLANDFRLTDYSETVKELNEFRGKYIVLNFWATWCPFCIDEMPEFQEVYEDYAAQGLEIIAVNRGESLEKAKKFTDPLNLTYPLFLNRADDVAREYGIFGMPSTYFINPEGEIVAIKQGPMDAEELEGRLFEHFNLGEKKEMRENAIEPQEAPLVPEEAKQSNRTIFLTDGVKHSVPLSDILGGGPPKDGIPSIDDPKFVSIAQADEIILDDGLGIAVSFNGVHRFYPNQILVWHEIVNDTIAGQSALITYCPLCGTGVVFDPLVKDQPTEFGTSGKLWNSNLIMYDRQTDTYWSQVLGEAILGELTGTKLALLPHQNITYKNWKQQYPNGEVLSTDTGQRRDYTASPYGNYDNNKEVFFPVDATDDRYHPKAPVYQIEVNKQVKLYPLEELDKTSGSFKDTVGGEALGITYDTDNKTIKIFKESNGEEVIPFYGFWFSVIAVHEDVEVFTR